MKKILVCLLIAILALTVLTACNKGELNGDDNKGGDGDCEHTGGTATCITLAVCSECGESYGELDPTNHEKPEKGWVTSNEAHVEGYECCKVTEGEPVAHKWSNGKCSTCKFECTHEIDEDSNACKYCQPASQGLAYVLVGPTDSYKVNGIGSCTDADIVIPSTFNGKPVTSIASRAFKDCANIKSVTLPDSVTAIGNEAFSGCTRLKTLTLPANLESIGKSAFEKCGVLKNVTFETTDGWAVAETEKATSTKDVSADIADTAKAAGYLKNTYKSYYWSRKVSG